MLHEEKENQVDTTALRAELKLWENAFREQNGRKAGREDIKRDTFISAKYKLYNELTRLSKQQQTACTPRKSTRPAAATKHSPAKAQIRGPSTTPRQTPIRPKPTVHAPSNVLSPVKEAEPEPTPQWIRAGLGPTPQRDGHVLGLFDIEDDVQETPMRAGRAAVENDAVAATPSRSTSSVQHIHLKSPGSSNGKRFMLAAFAGTPVKRKRDSDDTGTISSSKRKFATPSFLRRCNPLARTNENEDLSEPNSRPPFQKRGLVRSLSTIIQNLKKQQNQEMDAEWDIMDELEAEARGEALQRKEMPEIQVEDSQVIEMPLGPDQAPESSDEDSATEKNGPTRKPWKKKGLKRQTRRTNMKPVLHKPRKEGDDEPEHSEDESKRVAETQSQEAEDGSDDGDERTESEVGKPKPKKELKPAKINKDQSKEVDKNDSKKKPRKVNAEAHANYRRLNIKNKNSKAKGRGRFGRR